MKTDELNTLVAEIDEIKEHGFSEMEAIELLKLAELREISKELQDTMYIAGDVTVFPGVPE